MMKAIIDYLAKLAGKFKIIVWGGIEILRDGKPSLQVNFKGGVEKEGISIEDKDD